MVLLLPTPTWPKFTDLDHKGILTMPGSAAPIFDGSPNALHLWRSPLQASPQQLAAYANLLSPDEHQRAQRLRFAQHRDRFVVGRGLLRSLLGQYLGQDPASLVFSYGPSGKPALVSDAATVNFNLAHSEDWMLVAIAPRRVGVDLERIKPMPDQTAIAQRFFAPQEAAQIAADPDLFFPVWTAREALLKATGRGLAGLADLELAIGPQGVGLHRWQGEQVGDWWLHSFTPAGGFVGAVAVELGGGGKPPGEAYSVHYGEFGAA